MIYNGRQLSEHFHSPSFAETTLSLDKEFVVTGHLYLPSWEAEIQKGLNRLGVTNPSKCYVILGIEQPRILGFSSRIIHLLPKGFPLAEHLDTPNACAGSTRALAIGTMSALTPSSSRRNRRPPRS